MKNKLMLYESPVGDIYCLFEEEFLIEVRIDINHLMIQGFRDSRRQSDHSNSRPHSCMLTDEFDAYFKEGLKQFNQKVKFITGTDFQHKVWLVLKDIPYGETRSYKWVAEKVGSPKAVRAVGQALKKNPLPIILPCHRVIASDGSIGGYSCGIDVKKWLLRHEGSEFTIR